ncbi:RNA recognition motif domain-containing protein [Ditylenchus destructor]|uniref:RNA recognition motif domain-containing protein n=1 Tax=Ditylenchus destructor TaxID=166010 RepID=A0AAD4N1R5_9BILA|nr:RNA recognition motif domain-containing protein [Ditylenchus destructor]
MSSLRNILQRCVRNASILGGTPLQIQYTFNSVYSDPSCISRQAYSSDANEAPKNAIDPVQKSSISQMDRALNSLPSSTFTFIDAKDTKNVRPGSLGRKQLTFNVLDLSPKTTTVSQIAFYSSIGSGGKAYLEAKEVPEGITEEELIAFYSKYGRVSECRLRRGKTGVVHAYVSYSSADEIDRAMDDRPHIINGKPLKIRSRGRVHHTSFSLFVGSLPENVTEEALRKEFSKYGKPVFWKLENDGHFNQSGPYGIVMYATDEEALNALNNGPHTIEGAVVDTNSWPPMSSLRNILQRCVRNASILGGTPLQIQCTFNPVYSDPSCISRQPYSSDANEAPKNAIDPAQKSSIGQMDRALNSLLSSTFTFIDAKDTKNVRPGSLGRKQLTFNVLDLSPKTTIVSQIAFCSSIGSGGVLEAKEVPEGITEEELIAFYSKYGRVSECRLCRDKTGVVHAYVSYSSADELNRAMADRPHIINGKPLKITSRARGPHTSFSLFVGSLPENVTEEALRKEFSKYGKPVFWELRNDRHRYFNQPGPYGIVKYATNEEALNALNNGPHTIEGSFVAVRKGAKRKL